MLLRGPSRNKLTNHRDQINRHRHHCFGRRLVRRLIFGRRFVIRLILIVSKDSPDTVFVPIWWIL
jgi:hypothetical protein